MSDTIYGIVWRMPADPTPAQQLAERTIHSGTAKELEAAAAMAMGGRVHAIGSTWTSKADLYDEEGRYAGSILGHTVTLDPHLPGPPVLIEMGSAVAKYVLAYEGVADLLASLGDRSHGLAEGDTYRVIADLLHPKPKSYPLDAWLKAQMPPENPAEFQAGDQFEWKGRDGSVETITLVKLEEAPALKTKVWYCNKIEQSGEAYNVTRSEDQLLGRDYRRLPRK